MENIGSKVEWVPADITVNLSGHNVPGGLLYIGKKTPALDAQQMRYFDPDLVVARKFDSQHVARMGYYPDYNTILPDQRLLFLEWMKSGRRFSGIDVGYPFIYFYGLEQRIVSGQATVTDEIDILGEVRRLYGVYKSSKSFAQYAGAFIDALEARIYLRDLTQAIAYGPERHFDQSQQNFTHRAAVAQLLNSGKKLDFSQAYTCYLHAQKYGSARLQGSEEPDSEGYRAKIKALFLETFPEGFRPKFRKLRTLEIPYKTASRAAGQVDLAKGASPVSLPDPYFSDWSGLSKMLDQVRLPWLERLKTVRSFGFDPGSAEERITPETRSWLERECTPTAIVGVGELAKKLNFRYTDYISTKAYKAAAFFLAEAGYVLVPSPDEVSGGLDPDDKVAIYAGADAAPSPLYFAVEAARRIVIQFANQHRQAAPKIFAAFEKVTAPLEMPTADAARLRARIELSLEGGYSPPSKHYDQIINRLNADDRQITLNIVAATVAASGIANGKTLAILEKFYDKLRVSRTSLYSSLHGGGIGPTTYATRPVKAEGPGAASKTFKIPSPPPPAAGTGETASYSLDKALIQAIAADTDRVNAALGKIFLDDPASTSAAPEKQEPPQKAPAFPGLATGASSLLIIIITKQTWPRSEFEAAARSVGQMADGVIEAINEWAFDRFDAPLIEDRDPISIDLSLIEELAEQKKI